MSIKEKDENGHLKDFDVVAHVIPAPLGTFLTSNGKKELVYYTYINKYGLTIGAQIQSNDGQIHSYDYFVWEEIMGYKDYSIDILKKTTRIP